MAKGMFTQGIAVLASSAPALADVEQAVRPFRVLGRPLVEAAPASWMGGYPALVLEWRPEVNGRLLVDVVDQPWPDGMGDPASQPELFGAWSMGWFGPWVFPGNLERALAQSYAWENAEEPVRAHRAFIRVKSSYVLGADEDAPVLPEDYDAEAELDALTSIARRLMALPQALAFFDPNGEQLLSAALLEEAVAHDAAASIPPLDVWTNVRVMNAGDGWTLMDTVGMSQLDLPDHEACFPRDLVDANDVAAFLRNLSLYVLRRGQVIKDRDTVDGPGGPWRARHAKDGLTAPPRSALRWFPEAAPSPPSQLLTGLEE